MSSNSFGRLFSFLSFGESHGPAVGCVIDGCPPRVPLKEADIQPWLDRRRPGRNQFVTPRNEADAVRIMSGVYQGMTTGHPILLMVENNNQRSSDYSAVEKVFRPGHADCTYLWKYGIRDPRGGGRSSARETVARVAAGAVASLVLKQFPPTDRIEIKAGLVQLGGVAADPERWSDEAVDANPFFCPDGEAVPAMAEAVEKARADGDSLGGVVEIRARNVPPGLGEPVYDRLDGRIGAACLGLNAVKGVEIGSGFAAAAATGLTNNDPMRESDTEMAGHCFVTNNAGGILGGISTGAEVVVRCALKPTPSIAAGQQTVDTDLHECDIAIGGRHDPAVCIRAVPVLEATLWCILADFAMLHRSRINGL